MKIKGLIVMTSVIALMLGSCAKSSFKNAKLQSSEDSLSYAFGINIYNSLAADSLMLDPILVAKAMMDGKEGKPVMTEEIARGTIMRFVNGREAEKSKKKAEHAARSRENNLSQRKWSSHRTCARQAEQYFLLRKILRVYHFLQRFFS